MKRPFISLLAGGVLCGIALAQEPAPTQSSPTPQEQQQTPSSAAPATQAPEPSTSPTPEAQPAPQQTVPQAQPQAAQPAPQTAPPTAQSSSTPSTPRIAPGSVIPVQLTKSLDVKKAKTGDEVVAKVTMDLKTNSGEVIVPKDTKVVGHVTEAQPRSKEQKSSQVGIFFDHAVMKSGDMQLPMSIQAIVAPPSANPGNDSPSTAPGGTASGTSPNGARAGGMNNSPQPNASASSADNTQTETAAGAGAAPAITGKTEGVVGFKDLKLTTTAPNSTQGSLVSSEKNNVKLENGTFMLLRVNQ